MTIRDLTEKRSSAVSELTHLEGHVLPRANEYVARARHCLATAEKNLSAVSDTTHRPQLERELDIARKNVATGKADVSKWQKQVDAQKAELASLNEQIKEARMSLRSVPEVVG